MSLTDIDILNERFGVADHVVFMDGPGGLPIAELVNDEGEARICLLGAHVLQFKPGGEEQVFWLSSESYFEEGKEIRGGIPVCWPCFAVHPTDESLPLHGFVRSRMWEVLRTGVGGDGCVEIELGTRDDEVTRAMWPHGFELRVVVSVGKAISVELITRNSGDEAFVVSGALHSYFALSDVRLVEIAGLEGCEYGDKVDSMAKKRQEGNIRIIDETDRVYVDTAADTVIEDSLSGRRVRISKKGSRTTVVWNPWIDKAARMADFGDTEYLGMVCVETANAADDVYEVGPGEEHRLETIISVERAE